MHKRGHKRKPSAEGSVELNVMPFIDIFSLLCTFLLFSAVFVSIGVIEVQVPFLSNAAPSKDKEEKKNEVTIDLKVDVDRSNIKVTVIPSNAPSKPETETYTNSKADIERMHDYLVSLKSKYKTSDKASLFFDGDVNYEGMVSILDAIKFADKTSRDLFLFEKIILQGVIL